MRLEIEIKESRYVRFLMSNITFVCSFSHYTCFNGCQRALTFKFKILFPVWLYHFTVLTEGGRPPQHNFWLYKLIIWFQMVLQKCEFELS